MLNREEMTAARHLHAEMTELCMNLSEPGELAELMTRWCVELRERFEFEPETDRWLSL